MSRAQHFCTFSFYELRSRFSRDVFDAAKQLSDFEPINFPSTATYFDAFDSSATRPAIGTIDKKEGVVVLGLDSPRPSDGKYPVDVELAKYLKSLKAVFSPKLRNQKTQILCFLDAVRRLDVELIRLSATQSDYVAQRHPNVPLVRATDFLTFVRCQAGQAQREYGGLHSDVMPGTKTVISNIPTVFRDRTGPNRYSYDPKLVTAGAYNAATFDMAITEHGPPAMNPQYREFLALAR